MLKSTGYTTDLFNHKLSEERNDIDNTDNQNELFDDNMMQKSEQLKRRKFLGISLLGMAGFSLPFSAVAAGNNSVEDFVKEVISSETELYKKQSDSFETKTGQKRTTEWYDP